MTRPLEVTSSSSTLSTSIAYDAGANAPLQTSAPGDEGLHVKRLQESLARLRFGEAEATGTYDKATRQAVAQFQEDNDLPVSGKYDEATRKALRLALNERMPLEGPRLKVGMRGDAVRTLKEKLKEKGYYDGPVNDVYDAKTAAAVKRLEKKLGSLQNGVVGRKIWRELGGAGVGSGSSLKAGDTGPAVNQLQQRLIQLGHLEKGHTTGTFDKATERAVKSLEKERGLRSDGKVGDKVWEQMRVHQLVQDSYGGPELKKGQTGGAVRKLEAALARKGLFDGKADGKFDAATEAAVKKLEKRRGWNTDGKVGSRLWNVLGGAGKGSGPHLEQGSTNTAAVQVLQRKLKARGHYDGPVDGDFGPVTARALNAFKARNGLERDGVAGQAVWKKLGVHVVTNPVTSASDSSEPPQNYSRVREDEGWINVRTQVMLRRAEEYARKMGVKNPFYIVQGSYTSGVSASAGTHDGGGALDVRTWDRSRQDVSKMVKALRMAGFAAWKRGYGDDNMDVHIHAIAIGDRDLSGDARSQVAEYFRGGDGLVGPAGDGDSEVGRPWPKWANKYR